MVKANANTIKNIINIKEVKWVGWFYPEYKTDLTDDVIKDNMINIILFHDKNIQDTINRLNEVGHSESEYYCRDDLYCAYKNINQNQITA